MPKQDDHEKLIGGLAAIDAAINQTQQSETGLFDLLSMLASQFLGVPRLSMPSVAAPDQGSAADQDKDPGPSKAPQSEARTATPGGRR